MIKVYRSTCPEAVPIDYSYNMPRSKVQWIALFHEGRSIMEDAIVKLRVVIWAEDIELGEQTSLKARGVVNCQAVNSRQSNRLLSLVPSQEPPFSAVIASVLDEQDHSLYFPIPLVGRPEVLGSKNVRFHILRPPRWVTEIPSIYLSEVI